MAGIPGIRRLERLRIHGQGDRVFLLPAAIHARAAANTGRIAMPIMSLQEAIATHVADGQTVAMEGFTHLIPFAAGHEIIRQRKRGLILVRMTPDPVYDQIIGAGWD